MPEILVLVLARIVWLRSLTCYLTSRFYPSSQSGRDIVIYQQQNHKYFDSILILLSGQFGDTGQHISPSLSDQISLSFYSFCDYFRLNFTMLQAIFSLSFKYYLTSDSLVSQINLLAGILSLLNIVKDNILSNNTSFISGMHGRSTDHLRLVKQASRSSDKNHRLRPLGARSVADARGQADITRQSNLGPPRQQTS